MLVTLSKPTRKVQILAEVAILGTTLLHKVDTASLADALRGRLGRNGAA